MKRTKLCLLMSLLLIVWGSASVYAGGGFDDIANKAKKANETVRNVNEVIRDIDQTVEGVGSAKEGVGDIGKDTQGVLGIDTTQQQTPAQTSTTSPAQAPGQVQTTPTGAMPKPPTPAYKSPTYRIAANQDANRPRLKNISQAELQKWFEIEDQRKYEEYLANSGFISREEFNRRDDILAYQAYEEAYGQYMEQDMAGWISSDGDMKEAIAQLWVSDSRTSPGYPFERMRIHLGFVIPQPDGIRVSTFNRRDRNHTDEVFSVCFPYSDQLFNSYKQTIERSVGGVMEPNPNYGTTSGAHEYQYVLRSNRSGDGIPYLIELRRNRISNISTREYYSFNLTLTELGRDP